MIEVFKEFYDIEKFSSYEGIKIFRDRFDLEKSIKKFIDKADNVEEKGFFDYIELIDSFIHRLDQMILSIAPYSYKDIAVSLQNDLNGLRNFLDTIPKDYSRFRSLNRNPLNIEKYKLPKEEKTSIPPQIEVVDENLSILPTNNKPSVDHEKNRRFIKDLLKKNSNKSKPVEVSEIKPEIENDNVNNEIESFQDECVTENNSTVFFIEEPVVEEEKPDEKAIFLEYRKKIIAGRNMLIQTLLDIYHEKKAPYRIMLSLFRGLDIYRRMSLSHEIFNKEKFMTNFKKYTMHFNQISLIELCLQKMPSYDFDFIENQIIYCLKIINDMIDKYRFRINFYDKLNFRSGFKSEIQDRIYWLYFPGKRRPKRDLDELYLIKSVTASSVGFSKSGKRSYASYLSIRDINIVNMIMQKLSYLYYKNQTVSKEMINFFRILENFENSKHEMSADKENDFRNEFKEIVYQASTKVDILRMVIDLNPKINPRDIRSLFPLTVTVMKEKIDIAFERIKKNKHELANSFNPLSKYSYIYDRKIFRIYRRV